MTKGGPDPSLPEDVEWETFEQIEEYVTNSSDSLLEAIIPSVLWNYLCAPTSRDPDTLREHRESVVADVRRVELFYDGIETELVQRSKLSNKSGEYRFLGEVLASINQAHFPISFTPLDQETTSSQSNSFADEITAIEQALADEQETLDLVGRLVTPPEAAFLREDERSYLERIHTTLAHSVYEGTKRKNRLVAKRKETLTLIVQEMTERRGEVVQVEKRAEPYLESETVGGIGELVSDVQAIEDRLYSVKDEQPVERVDHTLATEFTELEQRISTLRTELEQRQLDIAENKLEQVLATIREVLPKTEQTVRSAKKRGKVLNSPETLLEEIESAREKIQSFCESPHASVVSADQITDIRDYESELEEYRSYIEEKRWFDAEFNTRVDAFHRLQDDAAPYVEFERYLTEPRRAALNEQIQTLQTELRCLADEADFAVLGAIDEERLANLRTNVRSIKTHLKGYNPVFVRQQRETYAELFGEIGPADLTLTAEQQRAVVRNGVYNQVIAAAGTGKTLTLTARVAYLIEAQDIDPHRVLVVTYTNKATEEMQERLANQFGITDVEVRTINSFAYKLLQNAADGTIDVVDDNDKINLIDQEIRAARNDQSEFLDHYYEFLVHYNDVYFEDADFETKQEYVETRKNTTYVTLKGTEVKSRAEKLIADFLFKNSITYQYEDQATWAETDSDKSGYAPDFHLPTYDVYIEHWGVDESGSVAPWFSWSTQQYHEKIQWARQQFGDSEYTLINTYEFEHEAGRLKDVLRHRLRHHGVVLDRMEFEDFVEEAFDYEHRERWIKQQFKSFIENAKLFGLSPDEIGKNLSPRNPRQYHFGQCGIHLLKQYSSYLTRHDLIDFTDQIRNAINLIQNNPHTYKTQYDHVLVDEFQDIGAEKVELVQELTGPEAARLFAVGDDWQSIYSFQGANIQYLTEFDEYFDTAVRTDLTANFRSPPSVIDAGNALINRNSEQLSKTVRATTDFDTTPRVHPLRGYRETFYDYVRCVRNYTTSLVRRYLDAGADPSEIMILCRYDDARPFLDKIKAGLQTQEVPYVGKDRAKQYRGPDGEAEDGVSVYAVHQAKGREANYVIVVDLVEGSYGFPPDDRENELLTPVQPLGVGGIEEERRLFYVAITRAKRRVDLLTRANQESRFLDEISEYTQIVDTGRVEPLEDVGDRMTIEVRVAELLESRWKQHQRGVLMDRYCGSAQFVSWMNDMPPTLERGEWYRLSDVLVDEYNDQKELVISNDRSVTHLPDGPQGPVPVEYPD